MTCMLSRGNNGSFYCPGSTLTLITVGRVNASGLGDDFSGGGLAKRLPPYTVIHPNADEGRDRLADELLVRTRERMIRPAVLCRSPIRPKH